CLREYAVSGTLHKLTVLRIHCPYSDHRGAVRLNFWRKAENAGQFDGTVSHNRGHGHAMDIAAWRDLRRIEVGVSVKPHEADFAVLPAKTLGHTGHRTDRYRMIAAKDDGGPVVRMDFKNEISYMRARVRNFFQLLHVRLA